MWWGVVCVLVSHFHEHRASIDGEEYPRYGNPLLKYGKILDFIDSHYSDVSGPEASFLNFGKHREDRISRDDNMPLTPMPKDVIKHYMDPRGATPFEKDYPMYTDYNADTFGATTAKDEGGALRMPRDEKGRKEPAKRKINADYIIKEFLKVPTRKMTDIAFWQDFSNSTEKLLKLFDMQNPLIKYDTVSKRTTFDLHGKTYFDQITEQATMGATARHVATLIESHYLNNATDFDIHTGQATTSALNQQPKSSITIDSHYSPQYSTGSEIASVNNEDVTDLTRRTIDYHTTEKDDTTYSTTTIGHHTIVKEDPSQPKRQDTTNEKTPQTKFKEITWAVETLATVMETTTSGDSIVYDNASYFENTNLGMTSTTIVAILESSITQITPTRSASVKTTYPEESPTTFGTEETTQNFGTDVTTQSTFVEPTEVTVPFYKSPKLRFMDLPVTKPPGMAQAQGMAQGMAPELAPAVAPVAMGAASKQQMDVPGILNLLDEVADLDKFNLTEKFKEGLAKLKIPTCATTPSTESSTLNFNDAPVKAKCFVCGLDVEGVPYTSACADAFAGDFIPLVPIDPKARGQIARFRKYCRYLDVNRTITTEDEPHSVFGRFERGCSVRWVDLSGIYTQRSCRNRRRAVMGKHFASKRMAKLEMALNDQENGCIISPVATLLPLSRGISLYARFHACVCTGSWCNTATATTQWMANNLIMFFFVTKVS